MHHVIGRVDEHQAIASAERHSRQNRRDPMHIRRACPREDELADGTAYRRDDDNADHGFGRHITRDRISLVAVDEPAEERLQNDSDERPRSHAHVRKSHQPWLPSSLLGEYDGIGHEAEIHDGVDDGDVQIPEHANGLGERHDDRPLEIELEQRPQRHFLVVAGVPPAIVRLLTYAGGAAPQDGGRVRFGNEAVGGEAGEAADHDDPVGPAPAEILEDEAADERADDGPVHGAQAPDAEGQRAVLLQRDVVDRARRVADHRRPRERSEEPHHQDRLQVLRQRARYHQHAEREHRY